MQTSNVWNHYSVVGTVTWLRAWWSAVPIPVGAKEFSVVLNVQTSSGAQLAFYSVRTMGHFPEVRRSGVKLTSHLHPVPKLRMNGAIPPVSPRGVDTETWPWPVKVITNLNVSNG